MAAENSKRQDKELSHWLVEVRCSLLGRSGQSTDVEGAWSGVVRLHICSDFSLSFLATVGVRAKSEENLSWGMGDGNLSSSGFSLAFLNSSSSSSISGLSHPK